MLPVFSFAAGFVAFNFTPFYGGHRKVDFIADITTAKVVLFSVLFGVVLAMYLTWRGSKP